MFFAEKPPILTGKDREDIAALRDYLFRMSGGLDDVAVAGTQTQTPIQISNRKDGQQVIRTGGSAADIEAVRKNAQALKQLIVKNAKDLQRQIDEIENSSFYVKYADDFTGLYPETMYDNPSASTAYMGVCTSTEETAPENPSAYKWSRIRGAGLNTAPVTLYMRSTEQPDPPEEDYTYTFSTGELSPAPASVSGHKLTGADAECTFHKAVFRNVEIVGHKAIINEWTREMPATDGRPCWAITAAAISDEDTDTIIPADWSEAVKIVEDGETGLTTYLHIKYSNDGQTFTVNPFSGVADGETPGAFIGMYSDFNPTDSMTFSAYEWHRFADDAELREIIAAGDNAVIEYCDKKEETYNSRYLAQSTFGTFAENIDSRIETTAKGVVESYQYEAAISSVQEQIGVVQDYFTRVNGEIRRGYIEDPENPGEYVFGIAISSDLQFSGAVQDMGGYTYYELEGNQTFGLYTSTGWQFWINGYKRGWFDSVDGMLHVASIQVEESMLIGGSWQIRSSTDGSEFEILYVGG